MNTFLMCRNSFHKVRIQLLSLACLWLAVGVTGRAEDAWHKVTSRHFTVYTQGSAKSAREWAGQLDLFTQAMQSIFPVSEDRLEPVDVIIFKNKKAFAPFKPQLFRNNDNLAAAFVHNAGYNVILMSDDADIRQSQHTIFHEATHWYFSALGKVRSPWLEEGLAEVFASFDLENGVGMIGGDDAYHVETITRTGFIPTRQLFNRSMGILHQTNTAETQVYYAESWLLVNYVLMKDGLKGLEKLDRFAERIQDKEIASVALKEIFGFTYETLDAELLDYTNRVSLKQLRLSAKLAARGATFPVTAASSDDVNYALGLALVICGKGSEAEGYFGKIIAHAPNDPRGYEGMGGVASLKGDRKAMVEAYTQASAKGSHYFLAHFYAQLGAVQVMIGNELAADGSDAELARKTVDALKVTARLRPSFYKAYEAMAGLMGAVGSATTDDEAFLKDARDRFPDDAMLEAGQAALEIKAGRFATAKKRIDRIRSGELTAGDVERAGYYARKLEVRLAAIVNLKWTEKYYDEGKLAEARVQVDRLLGQPLLPAEQVKYTQLLNSISAEETFAMVREAIAKKDLDLAGTWLGDIKAEELTPKAVETLNQLKAQVAAAKK